ncbi:hypothetical protein BSKO_11637 [Bryopsis sp. KO-2023]|nr:hypothetical protein BSKO_11637 [Bryopsis sp. KO-2023]
MIVSRANTSRATSRVDVSRTPRVGVSASSIKYVNSSSRGKLIQQPLVPSNGVGVCAFSRRQPSFKPSIVASAKDGYKERRYKKTAQKALDVNLRPDWYGTLAEIGAGQEVARWFFRVGAAAGTVAKSVSAYDMTISDSMYGACARYVTRERVESMLDYEYLQCSLTLKKARGDTSQFFAFADTVVAKAFGRDNECHGWLGIKFQTAPGKDPCTIIVHCRLLENTAQAQQESIGILGVNLIHGALAHSSDTNAFLNGLLDDLDRSKIEIDVVEFSGPDYEHVDRRLIMLRLVQNGLTDAAIFNPSGEPMIPQEVLYKKNALLLRGRFRPLTRLHNDMLMGAASQFFCSTLDEDLMENGIEGNGNGGYDSCVFRDDTEVFLEMTTRDMMESGDLLDWTTELGVDEAAFLQRMEAMSRMGYIVMLSSFQRYFSLAAYLRRYTTEAIVIAMGVPAIKSLFNDQYYKDLPGGILENFGRLLKFDLKLYVYPTLDPATGKLITARDIKVDPSVQTLFDYIYQKGAVVPIAGYDQSLLTFGDVSTRVVESIRRGTDEWEQLVPRHVANQIKSQRLWGYRPKESGVKEKEVAKIA